MIVFYHTVQSKLHRHQPTNWLKSVLNHREELKWSKRGIELLLLLARLPVPKNTCQHRQTTIIPCHHYKKRIVSAWHVRVWWRGWWWWLVLNWTNFLTVSDPTPPDLTLWRNLINSLLLLTYRRNHRPIFLKMHWHCQESEIIMRKKERDTSARAHKHTRTQCAHSSDLMRWMRRSHKCRGGWLYG